ncbi:MAG TPA: porin [Saprospiraceae bacterium]|nr:porin [Saprospiraceae bacterium]
MRFIRWVLLLSGLVIINAISFAQAIEETFIPNAPFFNFGSGLSISSPDDIFKMNFRFRLQNRASYVIDDKQRHVINGQVRRLRLRFDGHVGNPKFLYLLQLSFAPGDLGGELIDGENINIIRDAVLFYKATERLSVGFGQTKLPGNRQRVNSSSAMQLTDRTINNARFNIDRDFGIFANYESLIGDTKAVYVLRSAISGGEGRNFTQSQNTGLCYTNKIELLPFGKFKRDGAYFEGDVLREATPKLLVSAAYYYNHKTTKTAGQLGERFNGAINLNGWLIDGIFKYKGLGLMYAFMNRNTNLYRVNSFNNNDISIFAGKGHDFQASYFVSKKWEIIAKHSMIQTNEKVRQYLGDASQSGIGLTNYLWQHAFKIQMEFSQDRKISLNQNITKSYFGRLQMEIGI